MGIGSLGSLSFWQQDQNFWNQAQQQAQSQAASNALITAIGNLQTNKVRGLASIANQTALNRVNAQLQSALQSAIQTSQGGSSTSSSSTPTSTNGSPATGTGTVPLTAGTSLLTLGIPPTGSITVSDGTNTTTYSSTGTDTVGDLVNALNQPNVYGNAQVAAWLNTSGDLVIQGLNNTDPVSVGGTFASNVGFGAKNSSFQATPPTPAGSSSSSSATSSGSSSATGSTTSGGGTSSSSTTTNTTPPPTLFNSSYAAQTAGTALTLWLSGTSLNLLA